MVDRVKIVGVLDDGPVGLPPASLTAIRNADLVIGGTRTLALFAATIANAERRDLTGKLTSVPAWIDDALKAGKRVVALATGDPGFHGIGAYLVKALGAGRVEIVPAVSTMQWAFARFGLPWQGATLVSVHGEEAGEWTPGDRPSHRMTPLVQALGAPLIGLLTSPENGPARVARTVVAAGWGEGYTIRIAERLHADDEKLVGPIGMIEATSMTFAEPNVVILERTDETRPPRFGLPDEAYTKRSPQKGLITRREVRAVSLAMMGLAPDAVVWDIGAGSGSVGLEAARLAPMGHVYALEKNEADVAVASANRAEMRVNNHTLLHAKAPEGIDTFPDPDAIFIGGSGGALDELVEIAVDRLRPGGRLVMNFVTIENLSAAVETVKKLGLSWAMTQVNVARSEPILSMNRLQAENPVWIVSVVKERP